MFLGMNSQASAYPAIKLNCAPDVSCVTYA